MTKYYLQLNRFGKPGEFLFVGPFDTNQSAQLKINKANSNNHRVLYEEFVGPEENSNALHVKVVNQTSAKKNGLNKDKLLTEIPATDLFEVYYPETKQGKITQEAETSKVSVKETAIIEKPILDGTHRLIIVTRYLSTVQWLRNNGINGEVVDRVRNPSQIKDAIVIGTLPYRLAAETYMIGTVDMPRLRADLRGTPLTTEDMDDAGAELRWYKILKAE